MIKNKKNYYFIIIFLLIYIVFYSQEIQLTIYQQKYDLEKDGLYVLYNPIYSKETTNKPCKLLETDILRELPDGYQFIDYIYKIENNSLSTFHRDVTSSKQIFKTKHTVYTVILYKYDGELLSLCPNSNKSYPFVCSRIINYSGKSGTCFIFNCDVLHAGMPNLYCKDKSIIQYKICHKDDLSKLLHLSGIQQKYNKECIPFTVYNYFQRKFSYFFEMPINTFFSPLLEKKYEEGSWIGTIQSYFNTLTFYNNN
jgi:hypothetical protein